MRLFIIGYKDQTIAVVSSIQLGFDKIKEWNPSSILVLTDFDYIEPISISSETILAVTTRTDGTKVEWWIRSIKSYL